MFTESCRFRFHGEVNDLLPVEQRNGWIEYPLGDRVAVKHAIEALGVPHTEVDAILIDDQPIAFDHILASDDRVHVYSADAYQPSACAQLRPSIPRPVRFVLDTHLGRLAAYLRMLGVDSLYGNDLEDAELARLAHEQRRVLLTRDRGLLKRKIVVFGHCIRQTDPRDQLVDVVRRYSLAAEVDPWTRCVNCNGLLEAVDKAEIDHLLEPKTRRYYHSFQRCTQCGQIYWRGSHHERIRSFLSGVLQDATNGAPLSSL